MGALELDCTEQLSSACAAACLMWLPGACPVLGPRPGRRPRRPPDIQPDFRCDLHVFLGRVLAAGQSKSCKTKRAFIVSPPGLSKYHQLWLLCISFFLFAFFSIFVSSLFVQQATQQLGFCGLFFHCFPRFSGHGPCSEWLTRRLYLSLLWQL